MVGLMWFSERKYCVLIRITGFATAAVVVLTLLGCALDRTARQEVSTVIEKFDKDREHQARLYSQAPTSQPVTERAVRPRQQDVLPATLREFIVLALENNPEIKQAEDIMRAKVERIAQVTALPDPIVRTKTLPEPVRTAEGDNFFILGISQKFPVPEKLDRAGRIALEETRMAISRLEQTRLRVIGEVKRAYFRLYIIDRTIQILQENQDLLKSLIDVASGQVAAGRRSQEDVLRAQVELSNLEAQLINLRQRRATTVAMLNTLLDSAPDTPIGSPEPFDIRKVEIKLKKILALGAGSNPELKRFAQQIDRDSQAVALAKLAWWPDFTIGFEWMLMESRRAFQPPVNPNTGKRPVAPQMSEDGSDNWAITFGFNLPIWFDKIRAGIVEAQRRLDASMHQYASMRNTIYFRIDDAFWRVRAQQELAELFDSTIIPQARQTYEVSRAGYVSGTSDFQYTIDNWQKWLMFTIQYHRSIGELERSVADLEQAIGLSLTEVGESHE